MRYYLFNDFASHWGVHFTSVNFTSNLLMIRCTCLLGAVFVKADIVKIARELCPRGVTGIVSSRVQLLMLSTPISNGFPQI